VKNAAVFIEQTWSYNESYAPKIHTSNSEFSDGVLLFDIVILILHIPNALLICYFMHLLLSDLQKNVVDYIHCSLHGSLPVIRVTNQLAW
jgi:hypothetical protein